MLPTIGAGAFVKEEEQARKVVKQALEIGGGESEKPVAEPIHVEKIGRNDPCTCGSGKKYKHCHGA